MKFGLMGLINKVSMKTQGNVGAERVEAHIATTYALVEQLTPQLISMTLNQYLRGEVKAFATLWRDIRSRDDRIPNLEEKRIKSVGRIPFELVPFDEQAAGVDQQKKVLQYFFDHLTYTDCMNRDACGGFAALLRGIMLSLGYGWSVQEIVWVPGKEGMAAQFVQIPLECFRQEGGSLRFLPTEYAIKGVELDSNEWLVSSYPNPLGVASLILYYYKRMPLKDWLIYCKRYVIPALHGKTNAAKGDPDWDDLSNALSQFGQNWALLTGKDVEISPVQKSASGPLPYADLVDRCDRCLTALWRGADLSTMSSKDAAGASLQQAEQDVLVEDDATYVADIINHKLIPQVLRNTFGEGTKALVRFQLALPKKSIRQDLEIDTWFADKGIPLAVVDLRKRYSRAEPPKGAEVLEKKPVPQPLQDASGAKKSPSQPPKPSDAKEPTPNAAGAATQFLRQRQVLLSALSADLAPLRDKISWILTLDDAEFVNSLRQLADEAPQLFELLNQHKFEEALLDRSVDVFAEGWENGKKVEGGLA